MCDFYGKYFIATIQFKMRLQSNIRQTPVSVTINRASHFVVVLKFFFLFNSIWNYAMKIEEDDYFDGLN